MTERKFRPDACSVLCEGEAKFLYRLSFVSLLQSVPFILLEQIDVLI